MVARNRGWLVAQSAAVAVTAFLGLCQAAFAVSSDIHIGAGTTSTCPSGGCYVYGKEVNNLNGTTFDIFANNGSKTFSSELIILGVPNNPANDLTGNPLSSTTAITVGPSSFAGKTFTYSDKATGLVGEMTSSDVYTFLTLTGNNSNSFTNWAAADAAVNSVTAANFSIYLYETGASIAPKTGLDFSFSGLPLGTFVAGYATDSKGDLFDNAFTETGLTTTSSHPVPEPASLALLGAGLLGAGVVRLRRR